METSEDANTPVKDYPMKDGEKPTAEEMKPYCEYLDEHWESLEKLGPHSMQLPGAIHARQCPLSSNLCCVRLCQIMSDTDWHDEWLRIFGHELVY